MTLAKLSLKDFRYFLIEAASEAVAFMLLLQPLLSNTEHCVPVFQTSASNQSGFS